MNRHLDKFLEIVFAILAVGVVLFMILSQVLIKSPEMFPHWYKPLDNKWTYTTSSGKSGQLVLPTQLKLEENEVIKLTSILPDNFTDDTILATYTGINIEVYIDGIKRTDFNNSLNKIPGKVVKGGWVTLPVTQKDCGKTITLQMNIDDSDSDFFGRKIYYGNMYGIIRMILDDEGVLFVASFVLALFAVVTILAGWIYRFLTGKRLSSTMLAYAILAISTWNIYDLTMCQIIFDNYFVDGPVGYMVIMLAPFPFLKYMDMVQKHRYRFIYNLLEMIVLIYFAVFTFLHFMNIASFYDTLIAMNVVLGLVVVSTLMILLYEINKGYVKQYAFFATGLVCLIVMTLIEIVLINLIEHRIDGMCAMAGLYIMMLCAILQTVYEQNITRKKTIRAIQANKMKSTFLANMSHEIRTPINAIMGMNEMVLRKTDDHEIKEYAVNIRDASQTLLNIVNQVLDFSKIESGKLEITEGEYDTALLLNDVIKLIEEKAKQKNVEFILDISEKLPSGLYGDNVRIHQILVNVLNNAVKYTNEGRVTFLVDGVYDENDLLEFKLKICVKDTGIGIKESDMERIFKDFERLDLKKNRNVEGTGLGLAITKRLVELMDGNLSVESTYGIGSSFTIIIPQKIFDKTPVGNLSERYHEYIEGQSEYNQSYTAPMAKILVVDDNDMNLLVVEKLLKDTKMQITTCSGAADMYELVSKEKFNVILLDHMMPQISGIEALSHIKKMDNNLSIDAAVIVLTANAVVGMREKYLACGFDDYISKPIQGQILEEKIKEYLSDEILCSTELINFEEGLNNFSENRNKYLNYLSNLCRCIEKNIPVITKNVEDKQWGMYVQTVKQIKDAADKSGCAKLGNITKQLLAACDKEKFDYVAVTNTKLIEVCSKLLSDCEKYKTTFQKHNNKK